MYHNPSPSMSPRVTPEPFSKIRFFSAEASARALLKFTPVSRGASNVNPVWPVTGTFKGRMSNSAPKQNKAQPIHNEAKARHILGCYSRRSSIFNSSRVWRGQQTQLARELICPFNRPTNESFGYRRRWFYRLAHRRIALSARREGYRFG